MVQTVGLPFEQPSSTAGARQDYRLTRLAQATTQGLLLILVAVAYPLQAQDNPFSPFPGSYEVVRSTIPAPNAEIDYEWVADGRGLHST